MAYHYVCSKPRKNSLRLEQYDYSVNGLYFVTMVTANRELFFGDIVNGKVILSDLGQIANICWKAIPDHYPNVFLDEYVIMPNHIHGIVVIDNRVGKHASLSSIIGSFKSACTKICNRIQQIHHFGWLRGYHDRIICDDVALGKAREYIQLNPIRWSNDKNNPSNILNKDHKG